MKLLNMLHGIGGEFEINRVVGACGAVAYIVGANIFVAWDMLYNHRPFELIAYCAAFPGGLAVVVGAIAGAVSIKDRNVATAQIVRDTGALPAAPPIVPPTPQPVIVVNDADEAVPTTTGGDTP